MKRTPQRSFQIIPTYNTFGDNSECLQKIVIFSKFELWWPLVTSILTWPENDLSKTWRSHRGLSDAAYRLSLGSLVFEIIRWFPKPSTTNRTFQSPPRIGLKVNNFARRKQTQLNQAGPWTRGLAKSIWLGSVVSLRVLHCWFFYVREKS